MDLIRPWLAAAVAWVAATAAGAALIDSLATPAQLHSFGTAVAWQSGVNVAACALAAVAAALAHHSPYRWRGPPGSLWWKRPPRPRERSSRPRSALASLTVPAAVLTLGALPLARTPDPAWAVFTTWTLLSAAVAVAVWALTWCVRVRVRRRDRGRPAG